MKKKIRRWSVIRDQETKIIYVVTKYESYDEWKAEALNAESIIEVERCIITDGEKISGTLNNILDGITVLRY